MKMRAAILPLVACLALAGGVPRVRRQTQNCLGAVCQVTSLQVQDNSCGPRGCSSSSLGGVAASSLGGVAAVAAPPPSSAPPHLLRPGETRPLRCGGGAGGVATSCSAHSCSVTCGDGTQVMSFYKILVNNDNIVSSTWPLARAEAPF